MTTDAKETWFPLFEFQDWIYQSFLLLPTYAEEDAPAGAPVTAKKWARGSLVCGQAMRDGSAGYTLTGTLVFRPGVELSVEARGALGDGDAAATFEATGTGVGGPTKGMVSKLVGWVFPELPVTNGAARVRSVRGATWAVRGPDTKPDTDPSGMPLGTVGAFVISQGG